MPELTNNPVALAIFSAIIGGIVTATISKLNNKTAVFQYITFFNRIGLSADDNIFGSIRMSWQGHHVRNLYSYTIEIENSTTQDFESVYIKIYTANETWLLNEKTEIVESPYIVEWSQNYKNKMRVPDGQTPTQQQDYEYNHNREYQVDVFNRGQRLKFTYLCTRPNDDLEPFIAICTNTKGITLARKPNPSVMLNPIFGTPIPVAIVRGLIISMLVVLVSGLYFSNIWIASAICMAVGATAQILGAIEYKIEQYAKKIISG